MAYNGTLNLTSPAANRIFQRDVRTGNPAGNWSSVYGKGWGAVGLALSPSSPGTLLEYRVRDAAYPAQSVLRDWTTYTGAFSAGPATLSVTVPARSGWSLVDVRANGDNTSTATTAAFGVGEVIAASGQSLATDFWSTAATGDATTIAANSVVPSPFGTCLAAWDGGTTPSVQAAWLVPADGSIYPSTFCAEFLRLAVVGSGVNCGLVGYAWSGEPIASWAADGSGPKNAWTPLVATLDAAVGQGGKFGTFIWAHGHNDARYPQAGIDGDEITSGQYQLALGRVLAALAARYNASGFARILSSIPAIGANWISTTPKFSVPFLEQIRAAHLAYMSSDPQVLGHVDGLDLVLWSDQTHPSQAGNVTYARHFYRAFMRGLASGLYSSGDAGPALTGTAGRSLGGNHIFLPIKQGGGTQLVCAGGATGAATQFQVFRSGSTVAADQFPVASVDLSQSGAIVLSLTATPPDTQALDVWYRLPPDGTLALLPSNQIYDDNVSEIGIDGLTTGRELAMLPTPIGVPAPAGHQTILLRPGVPMLTRTAAPAFAL